MIHRRFEDSKSVPQRLKPSLAWCLTARLNPCPSSEFVANLCSRAWWGEFVASLLSRVSRPRPMGSLKSARSDVFATLHTDPREALGF
jgi:hypothetical protein